MLKVFKALGAADRQALPPRLWLSLWLENRAPCHSKANKQQRGWQEIHIKSMRALSLQRPCSGRHTSHSWRRTALPEFTRYQRPQLILLNVLLEMAPDWRFPIMCCVKSKVWESIFMECSALWAHSDLVPWFPKRNKTKTNEVSGR